MSTTSNGSVNGTANGSANGSMVSSEAPVRNVQETPAEAKTRDERSVAIVTLATKITTFAYDGLLAVQEQVEDGRRLAALVMALAASPTLIRNRIQPDKAKGETRVTTVIVEKQPEVKPTGKTVYQWQRQGFKAWDTAESLEACEAIREDMERRVSAIIHIRSLQDGKATAIPDNRSAEAKAKNAAVYAGKAKVPVTLIAKPSVLKTQCRVKGEQEWCDCANLDEAMEIRKSSLTEQPPLSVEIWEVMSNGNIVQR